MTELVAADGADLQAELARLRAKAETLKQKKFSDKTRKTYRELWDIFVPWCRDHGMEYLPASSDTLTLFAAGLASRDASPNTITSAISAIRAIHRYPEVWGLPRPETGWPVPDGMDATAVARGHRREKADAGWEEKQADALLVEHLRALRDSIDMSKLIGVRDWALILHGFAMGGRRSELSCLDVTDVRYDPPHWMITRICSSKTDQDGLGALVQVSRAQDHSLCAVRAVLNYVAILEMKGITDGPLYRSMQGRGTSMTIHGRAKHAEARKGRLSGQAIGFRYKVRCEQAGLEGRWSGHSARRGAATSARLSGADLIDIADHFRWARNSKSMMRYIEAIDARTRNVMRNVM